MRKQQPKDSSLDELDEHNQPTEPLLPVVPSPFSPTAPPSNSIFLPAPQQGTHHRVIHIYRPHLLQVDGDDLRAV